MFLKRHLYKQIAQQSVMIENEYLPRKNNMTMKTNGAYFILGKIKIQDYILEKYLPR